MTQVKTATPNQNKNRGWAIVQLLTLFGLTLEEMVEQLVYSFRARPQRYFVNAWATQKDETGHVKVAVKHGSNPSKAAQKEYKESIYRSLFSAIHIQDGKATIKAQAEFCNTDYGHATVVAVLKHMASQAQSKLLIPSNDKYCQHEYVIDLDAALFGTIFKVVSERSLAEQPKAASQAPKAAAVTETVASAQNIAPDSLLKDSETLKGMSRGMTNDTMDFRISSKGSLFIGRDTRIGEFQVKDGFTGLKRKVTKGFVAALARYFKYEGNRAKSSNETPMITVSVAPNGSAQFHIGGAKAPFGLGQMQPLGDAPTPKVEAQSAAQPAPTATSATKSTASAKQQPKKKAAKSARKAKQANGKSKKGHGMPPKTPAKQQHRPGQVIQ